MLLCPRDYLSSYLKIGTVAFLIIGVILVHPNLNMPAFTPFVHGGGPVIPGKVYPFVFITIACGAISGFHSLISSGTTPKMIAKESDARDDRLRRDADGGRGRRRRFDRRDVALSRRLFRHQHRAENRRAKVRYAQLVDDARRQQASILRPQEIDRLEAESGEKNLRGRTGGAVTLALGIAKIFDADTGTRGP